MNSDAKYVIERFKEGIKQIESRKWDNFHNQLYFSKVISLMEHYLSSLFVFEISNNEAALKKLANTNFSSTNVRVPYALNNCMKEHIINSMKNEVWHRLNVVDGYFKSVLGFRLNLSVAIRNKVEIRHDIVHRDGFTIHDKPVVISNKSLKECIVLVDALVSDVQAKYEAIGR